MFWHLRTPRLQATNLKCFPFGRARVLRCRRPTREIFLLFSLDSAQAYATTVSENPVALFVGNINSTQVISIPAMIREIRGFPAGSANFLRKCHARLNLLPQRHFIIAFSLHFATTKLTILPLFFSEMDQTFHIISVVFLFLLVSLIHTATICQAKMIFRTWFFSISCPSCWWPSSTQWWQRQFGKLSCTTFCWNFKPISKCVKVSPEWDFRSHGHQLHSAGRQGVADAQEQENGEHAHDGYCFSIHLSLN